MEKQEAIERLREIMEELIELGAEARDIISEAFPDELPHADGYGIFRFGTSSNPYDTTFEGLVASLRP